MSNSSGKQQPARGDVRVAAAARHNDEDPYLSDDDGDRTSSDYANNQTNIIRRVAVIRRKQSERYMGVAEVEAMIDTVWNETPDTPSTAATATAAAAESGMNVYMRLEWLLTENLRLAHRRGKVTTCGQRRKAWKRAQKLQRAVELKKMQATRVQAQQQQQQQQQQSSSSSERDAAAKKLPSASQKSAAVTAAAAAAAAKSIPASASTGNVAAQKSAANSGDSSGTATATPSARDNIDTSSSSLGTAATNDTGKKKAAPSATAASAAAPRAAARPSTASTAVTPAAQRSTTSTARANGAATKSTTTKPAAAGPPLPPPPPYERRSIIAQQHKATKTAAAAAAAALHSSSTSSLSKSTPGVPPSAAVNKSNSSGSGRTMQPTAAAPKPSTVAGGAVTSNRPPATAHLASRAESQNFPHWAADPADPVWDRVNLNIDGFNLNQDEWIDFVHFSTPQAPQHLQGYLRTLGRHKNIPRRQPQFTKHVMTMFNLTGKKGIDTAGKLWGHLKCRLVRPTVSSSSFRQQAQHMSMTGRQASNDLSQNERSQEAARLQSLPISAAPTYLRSYLRSVVDRKVVPRTKESLVNVVKLNLRGKALDEVWHFIEKHVHSPRSIPTAGANVVAAATTAAAASISHTTLDKTPNTTGSHQSANSGKQLNGTVSARPANALSTSSSIRSSGRASTQGTTSNRQVTAAIAPASQPTAKKSTTGCFSSLMAASRKKQMSMYMIAEHKTKAFSDYHPQYQTTARGPLWVTFLQEQNTAAVVPTAKLATRVKEWDPFWDPSFVIAADVTGQVVSPKADVHARTAAKITVDFGKIRQENPVQFGNEAKCEWGTVKTVKAGDLKVGESRLILKMMPLDPPLGAKGKADGHLWPKGTFLQITTGSVSTPIRIAQRKQQQHQASLWKGIGDHLDLTQYVSKTTDLSRQTIKIEMICRDEQPFLICLAFCRYRSPDAIVKMLTTPTSIAPIRRVYESKEEAKRQIVSLASSQMIVLDDSDDEGEKEENAGVFSFSLLDSYSKQIIKTPVRGSQCTHFQCFDLQAFVTGNKIVCGNRWRCLVCEKFLSLQDLEFCGLTHSVLQAYAGQASPTRNRVEFRSDGTHRLLNESKRTSNNRKRGPPPGGNPQESTNATKRPRVEDVEVIDIL